MKIFYLIPLPKISRIIFLSCFIVGLLTKAFSQGSLPQIIKENENSVFIIITYDKFGNPLAQGTGFFIDENGTAISNVHVFENSARSEIKTLSNKRLTVSKILAYNSDLDILKFSVLNPSGIKFKAVKISKEKPIKGSEILVISNPIGLESSVSNGIVSAVRELEKYGSTIQISAPISHGSSGAPVFNMKGEVIGIATFGFSKGQNLNFAVDIRSIYNLQNTIAITPQNLNKLSSNTDYISALDAYNSKDFEKALTYFIKVLSENKNDDTLSFYIGVCYGELGNHSLAIKYFDISLSRGYKGDGAYNNRGKEKSDLGDLTGALSDYNQAININPNIAEAFNNRGVLKRKMGDKFGAMSDYNKAIELDPNAGDFYNNRGNLKRELGDDFGVISDYTQALNAKTTSPDLIYDLYVNRGYAERKMGDNYAAMSDFNKAISISPNLYFAYLKRGNLKYKMGDTYGAISDLTQAVNINSQSDEAYLNLGSFYSDIGQTNNACDSWSKAANLGNLDAQTLYQRNCHR